MAKMKMASYRGWLVLLLGIVVAGVGYRALASALFAPPTGTWAPLGSMSSPRAGAAAVLLQDGRVLVTGGLASQAGTGTPAPVATADFLNTDGSISPAPSMTFARSGHTATVLQDGRVLVAGGTDASGNASQTAELFDPGTNAWSTAGPLMVGRSGATATLLQDGRVLIAGGAANGAALASLELFDPNSNTFSTPAGTLSSAREDHAAALLPNGQVIMAGGWDGTTLPPVAPATTGLPNVLSTSDIFDPATGLVSPGPALAVARMNFTATTQLDGSVAAIGGSDGQSDLASIEVLSPGAGAFALSGAVLTTARQGHQAFLLPHNANILVLGGTSGGAAVASAELYTPWLAAVTPTGAMSVERAGSTGAAFSNGTVASQNDGILVVAGGTDAGGNTLSSAEAYGFAWIKTDAADYAPGTPVYVSGAGWQPNEILNVTLVESPLIDTHGPYTVTVGPDGTFSGQLMTSTDASCATDGTPCTFSPDVHDINVLFTLTAAGAASQAQTAFTDANGDTTSVSVVCTPNPGSVGSGSTCTAEVDDTETSPSYGYPQGTVAFSLTGGGTLGGTFSNSGSCTVAQLATEKSNCSITFTPSAAGTRNVKVQFNPTGNNWKSSNDQSLSFTAGSSTVAITIQTSPPGLQVSVDGGAAQTAPITENWDPSSSHTIATTSPQAGAAGTQYVWSSWSDSGAISHSITVPGTGTTYTATFTTQYQVTFNSSGLGADATGTLVTVNGTPEPVSSFQEYLNSGTTVNYTYNSTVTSSLSGKQYALTTPAPTPSSGFSLTGPTTLTGTYKTQYQVTFAQSGIPNADISGSTDVLTVNASPESYSSLPYSAYYDSGATVNYSYNSPIASSNSGEQFVLTNSPGTSLNVSASTTITGDYKTQYQVTFAQSGIPNADISGSTDVLTVNASPESYSSLPYSAYYDSGATVNYSYNSPIASSNSGEQFVLTNSPGTSLNVSGSTTITGDYKTQYKLTLAITAGVPGGLTNITGGTNAAYYDSGTVLSLTAATPVADGAGKRWRFNNWTGDVSTPPNSSNPVGVTMSAPRSVTANYVVQWQLTLATNPNVLALAGAISGGTSGNYYDDGTVLSLGASTPVVSGATSYVFYNWTGDLSTSPNGNNPVSVTMNQARSITANYNSYAIAWDASSVFSGQYSDPTGLIADVSVNGSALPGVVVSFSVGTDNGSGTTNAGGVATESTSYTLSQAPGSYTATATCPAAYCGADVSVTDSYTINPEDARVVYSGLNYFGIPSTATSGTITVSTTVWDISNSRFASGQYADPAYDTYPGDIRKATVTFVDRDNGSATLCTASVGLVNPSDATTGTASCSFNGSTSHNGGNYTVGIVVGGYYTRNDSADDTGITIAQQVAGSISGGGYLVLTNYASGQLLPKAGLKNNFGFTVQYNKNKTNLQGNMNIIIRSAVGLDGATPCSTVHPGFTTCVYQVKGNQMSSLTVNTTSTGGTATFVGKASVQDVTDPSAPPISIDGGATLQVSMTDNGNPGTTDTISVQANAASNKGGGLWFSSNFQSGKTVQQLLGGGNLSVH